MIMPASMPRAHMERLTAPKLLSIPAHPCLHVGEMFRSTSATGIHCSPLHATLRLPAALEAPACECCGSTIICTGPTYHHCKFSTADADATRDAAGNLSPLHKLIDRVLPGVQAERDRPGVSHHTINERESVCDARAPRAHPPPTPPSCTGPLSTYS